LASEATAIPLGRKKAILLVAPNKYIDHDKSKIYSFLDYEQCVSDDSFLEHPLEPWKKSALTN
jgi:hypothetical protein